MKNRIATILTHLLFLTAFISFPVFTMPSMGKDLSLSGEDISYSLVLNNIMAAVGYYLNYYYFIPSFNIKRKYVQYAISLFLIACISILIPAACNVMLAELVLDFRFIDSLVVPAGPILMLTVASGILQLYYFLFYFWLLLLAFGQVNHPYLFYCKYLSLL
jgi:hypothetical protein